MFQYVIKSTVTHKSKTTGIEHTYTSFFKEITHRGLPISHMAGTQDEAMKFDCKSEAKRYIARKLGQRQSYTVEKFIS